MEAIFLILSLLFSRIPTEDEMSKYVNEEVSTQTTSSQLSSDEGKGFASLIR